MCRVGKQGWDESGNPSMDETNPRQIRENVRNKYCDEFTTKSQQKSNPVRSGTHLATHTTLLTRHKLIKTIHKNSIDYENEENEHRYVLYLASRNRVEKIWDMVQIDMRKDFYLWHKIEGDSSGGSFDMVSTQPTDKSQVQSIKNSSNCGIR